MIRDRIVVGIRDARLSERLQLDHKLTLDDAVTAVRQSEQVKQQQTVLRGTEIESATPVNAKGYNHRPPAEKCSNCGKSPGHNRDRCPARVAICHKCKSEDTFRLCADQQK